MRIDARKETVRNHGQHVEISRDPFRAYVWPLYNQRWAAREIYVFGGSVPVEKLEIKDQIALRQHLVGRGTRALRTLILVDKLDAATAATVDYALTLVPERVTGVHVAFSEVRCLQVKASWEARFGPVVPLVTMEPVNGLLSDSLSPIVNSELPDARHPVVIMVPRGRRAMKRLRRRRRDPARLVEAFADAADVSVVWINAW